MGKQDLGLMAEEWFDCATTRRYQPKPLAKRHWKQSQEHLDKQPQKSSPPHPHRATPRTASPVGNPIATNTPHDKPPPAPNTVHMPLKNAHWRVSTRSCSNGCGCVELASVCNAVAIRDSTNPSGPVLLVSKTALRAALQLVSQ
ncbi:DUF397 domain-containing protein [Spirillospora sp. NPDC048832]